MQQPAVPAGFEYLGPYVRKFLQQFPHVDRNVFVMMPFTAPASAPLYAAVGAELEEHGLVPLRADERAFSPVLWWNVVTHMVCSSYGVVVYEPGPGIPFNPNVSIEAGFMLALDRPVLFLASSALQSLPVDFSGHIYKTYDPRPGQAGPTARSAVKDWVERDLSYYAYGDKKLILFVSLGGTCRCVMAKALFAEYLDREKVTGVAVDAAAIADPSHSAVSPSAVKAVREVGCERWIAQHRPRKLCRYLQERAALIVAVTDRLLRGADPGGKVVTDRELFGASIPNPYPDQDDEASLVRYRAVREQLEAVLRDNLWTILGRAGALPTV